MVSVHDIAQALNLKPMRSARSGGYLGNCPVCGYKQAFTLQEKDGKALFYCQACKDSGMILEFFRQSGLWGKKCEKNHYSSLPVAKPAKAAKAGQGDYLKRLWEGAFPVVGTLAEKYLNLRRIAKATPEALRYLPSHKHSDTGLYFPVMLAAVRAVDGRLVGVHRTYLRPDGSGKADIQKPKKALGNISGAAVRLAEAGPILAVAEGIESGLAFMQETGIPTWAALSCGNIPALELPPLPLAREIVIAADNDPPGLRFAAQAAERWTLQGRRVRIAYPPTPGTDFADLMKAGIQ